MGLEDESIVIEIGSLYTRCGYSGESLPRAVVRNPSAVASLGFSSSYIECRKAFRDFLPYLYYHKIQAKPKDAATVLVEKLMGPKQIIRAAVDVVFTELQVPAVYLVLENSLPVYLTGDSSGLVVDCGYFDCRVFPVVSM